MSEHGGFDHWSPHSPQIVVAGKWFPHQRVDANRDRTHTVPNVNGLMTNRPEPQDVKPQNPEVSQQMPSTKVNTGRRKYRKRVPTESNPKKELKRLPKINTKDDNKKKYKKIQYQSLKLNRDAVAKIAKLKLILNEKREERTELENRFAELRLRLKKLEAGYSADEPRSSDSDTDTASEDGSVAQDQHDTESSNMATETATVPEVHNAPRVPELTADCSTITFEESPLVSLADLAQQIDGMFPQYDYDLDPIANMLTDEVSLCTSQPQQMANTFEENPLEILRQMEEPYGDYEVDMAIRMAMGSDEVKVNRIPPDPVAIIFEGNPVPTTANLDRQIQSMPTISDYNRELDNILEMELGGVSVPTCRQRWARQAKDGKTKLKRQYRKGGAKLSCPKWDRDYEMSPFADIAVRMATGPEEVKVNRIPPDPVATIFEGNPCVTTANLDGQIQSMPTISEYDCELDNILEMELGRVSVPTCRQRRARQPKGDKTKLKRQFPKGKAKLRCSRSKWDRKIEPVSLQGQRKAEIARRKLILEDRLREKEKLEICHAELCARLQKLEMGESIDEPKNYKTYLPPRMESAPEPRPVPVPATSSTTTFQGNQYNNNPPDLSQKINAINSKYKYELEPVLQNIQFLHKLTTEHSLKKLIPTLRQMKSSKPRPDR